MNEKVLKCLYDIKFAIDEVDSFFIERPKRFDEYSTDIILKRAVERNLEIIGEAMNRIIKEYPEFPIKNAKRIIGLRNQIIHGYDSVSDETSHENYFIHRRMIIGELHVAIKKQIINT
jgi:uncharacterized protein with HEPN domain